MQKKVHVKSGDQVIVINGKYRGKKGKVMQVSPSEGKVIVDGVNIVTKHVKPKKMGEPGGLIKAESALYASKVQLICPKCGKPTRTGSTVNAKGVKVRTCKQPGCNATFE
ncbi:MAG TPA: 50S ribosomal protein L24 [Clostridiales bacterium]|nr:MAG: 50S ribosomal protein L24 [Firmicutes bacterium ADurb.Bin262]HOU09725.1 50S ribosomal protein L24 [Clostridiales bacterium]HQH62627.1 50S ribosomal protein L24 [Clostridiales bacterium]HQK72516.1 50S ribosomal protein L24 [Clostridiales bacterium]